LQEALAMLEEPCRTTIMTGALLATRSRDVQH
jgi:hypothetical protein